MERQHVPEVDHEGALNLGARAAAGEEEVLGALRSFREEELRRETALVALAVHWARLNPGEMVDPADRLGRATLTPMEEMWEELAHHGCPHVEDLSIPAFAEAAGMTEFRAGSLIREALLLVFLLPRVWERAAAGQIEVWRARKLASECWGLRPAALAYIDRNMSLATARHTEHGRAGIIQEARIRYMPEEVAEEEAQAGEYRGVAFDWQEHGRAGVVEFGGAPDLNDARDLGAAVSAGAEAVRALGADAPLQVRRSWALGDLARAAHSNAASLPTSQPVAFHPDCACQQPRPRWDGRAPVASEVKVYLHLTPGALAASAEAAAARAPGARPPGAGASPGEVVRVEGKGIPAGTVFLPEVVKGWFSRPGPSPGHRVVIRPVVDLSDHHHTEAYEVPERIKEHVSLR